MYAKRKEPWSPSGREAVCDDSNEYISGHCTPGTPKDLRFLSLGTLHYSTWRQPDPVL